MKTLNATFEGLPERSFSKDIGTGETAMIIRGREGFFPQDQLKGRDPDELNAFWDITKAQSEAMFAGSMFGWHVPSSNPENYDENGVFIFKKKA